MNKKGVFTVAGVLLINLLLIGVNSAQNLILQPPAVENSVGGFDIKLLLKRDGSSRLIWKNLENNPIDLSDFGAKLLIGRTPNNYDLMSENVEAFFYDFIPDEIDLAPGRYFARITNSDKNSTNEIKEDFEANPSKIVFSNEVLLIIEADEAPSIIAPRGTIDNSTPTFQWTAVAGVPSYWLILSSQPFEIIEDDDGNISIEGASIVWQYMTSETNANYGDINFDSPFTDEALPLNSGQEYSYTVLNVYENNNPGFTSPVFGGIVPFIYEDPNAVPPTTLIAPEDGSEFIAEEYIVFEWNEVIEASNYTIVLNQIVKQQGIDVSIPIWSSTTTNTLIEYPAIDNLKNGNYEWNVISNNSSGGGTTSNSYKFAYSIPTGAFNAKIRSSIDNSTILGVELTARSVSGGVTPSLPFFVQESSYTDSLVAGTYEFVAKKDGYESNSIQKTINEDRTTNLTINLNALPSSISGIVVDETGETLQDVTVTAESIDGIIKENTKTDSDGNFSISLNEGSYSLDLRKSGYIGTEIENITLDLNEQINLDKAIELINDEASVSGYVFNDNGEAIQRARVEISNSENSYESFTNGTGSYSFVVSSGDWTVTTSKTGFVTPEEKNISITSGDIIQNLDFTLTGNANQISGFIRERITNEDGSSGTASFEGVEIRAIPTVGDVISTTSIRGGQYSLSLKNGSYTIIAYKENYSADNDQNLVLGVGETISGIDFVMLPNPSSISGTVLLPDGNGVNEALIDVQGVGTAYTSNSGYYSISVPEGQHTVSVSKSGLVSPDPKIISVAVGQSLTGVDYQMIPNAGSVSGNITSGGESLSEVEIVAKNSVSGVEKAIVNNLDGSYVFNLSSGNWYIVAEKPGFISDSTQILSVGPGQQVINQNLSLTQNLTTLRGTVSSDGNALRNVNITVIPTDNSDEELNTVTQNNGSFAISLPAGKIYDIKASLDGYKSENIVTEQLVPETEVNVDITLSANPSSVSGKVTLNGISTLSDVKIIAIDIAKVAIDSTITDSDGDYLLGLEPNEYIIKAVKPGYTVSEANTILNIGQNISGIDLSLDENFALISGTIVDTENNPIEQVFVNLQKKNGTGASEVTDQNGNFTISGLTTGEYTIELSKTGYIQINEDLELTDGDFLSVEKMMIAKTGSISGIISDENGSTIEGATITASDINGLEYVAVSNNEGLYSITSLEPSSYEVNAEATGYTSGSSINTEVTIDNLNVIDINISNLVPNNGIIKGTITNEFSGDPIKDVQVSAIGSRGSGFNVTDSEGNFEISNLIPSTYNLISTIDGFASDTIEVEIDSNNPTQISNISLIQNLGRLVGTVKDTDNQALPFLVTVKASSDKTVKTTKTNENGEFVFNDIETGDTYSVETDIFKEGYINAKEIVDVPIGSSETVIEKVIGVELTQGIITGNAGISGASIKLINDETSELIELASSNSNGDYNIEYLAAGSYKLVPSRSGYVFNPDTSNLITLSSTGTISQNFSAQANIGNITVTSKNSAQNPLANVEVSIVSEDTTVIQLAKSNSEGLVLFEEVKAGLDYYIRATLDGYTSSPVIDTVSLSSGNTVAVNFEMTANSAAISGVVKLENNGSISNLRSAKVSATLINTGQKFENITDQNGVYSFENLAPGDYSIIASKEGFTRDTVFASLTPGNLTQVSNLTLKQAFIRVVGNVKLKGEGVSDVKVSAISSSITETETNNNGVFNFSNLPVKIEDTDTTVYQFNISYGLFSKSYIREFTSNDIGKRFNLPVTNLPSGQINLLVTDGINPLEGAILQFGIEGGESEQIVTSSDGSFSSSDNLRKSTYIVSVSKEGLLLPKNTVRYELPSDTTVIDTTLALPFRQLNINEIFADQPTTISVVNPSGYDNSGSSGTLFYKTSTQTQYTSVEMVQSEDTLSAVIPALNSIEEITFYSSITDSISDNIFISNEKSIVPLASGILTNVRISPTINGLTLRAGETYSLELLVRDGINQTLNDDFDENGSGTITWTNVTDSTGLEIIQLTKTSIKLRVINSGSYTLKATASLEGSEVITSASFEANEIPLRNIVVNSPSKQLSNTSSHVFSYAAFDTSGNSILLGESINWSISPNIFGTIDNKGQFTPVNNSILGSFRTIVNDGISKISGASDQVEMVASIRPDVSYSFNNGEGFELSLLPGSVDFPSQLSLTETNPPPSKKFIYAQGSDQSYTVGDRIYVLSFSGSSLKNTAEMTLPADTTISELNNGEREIARFNYTTLQWEIFDPVRSKNLFNNEVGTIQTQKLGQFAVLAQNSPLGISHAAVLPSPFSPDIAPVKIGYWLDTPFPPAKVTIKIFNIRGELVRTLIEDDLQQPGRYGSSSSPLEIAWDGLTDNGNLARNGRYIIQIIAKDAESEEVKLLQVILIK